MASPFFSEAWVVHTALAMKHKLRISGEMFANSVHAQPLSLPSFHGSHMTQLRLSSVAQSCLTLCDPMDCSMPGFPVHYQLPELAQTHVHQVSDAIQPSHPPSSPSLPAFNLSQHQGLFQ